MNTKLCDCNFQTHSVANMQRWSYRAAKSALLFRSSWVRHSSSKLFVGGLSYDTNETVLRDAFQQHGQVIQVKIICDRVSGKSKGYGFVEFDSEITASTALNQMNGQMVDGRTVEASESLMLTSDFTL